jgi:2-phospho-L-lactate guanylyltransferase
MTVWAIVPVKPLNRAKSRLAEVLSKDERADLSRRMLVNTIEVLGKIPLLDRTLVISRDSEALKVAREHGARTVSERGSPRLNTALVRATLVAKRYGVSAVIVLPADLPKLSQSDIEEILSHAHDPPVVVIAPDRRGTGTNALLVSPPGLIEYDFGENSYQHHQERAEAAGARVEICLCPSLGFDIDLPEDLEELQRDELHSDTE